MECFVIISDVLPPSRILGDRVCDTLEGERRHRKEGGGDAKVKDWGPQNHASHFTSFPSPLHDDDQR